MNERKVVTLGYWKIRGLAERIRMLMEYLEVPYTQEIYTSDDRPQWFEHRKLQFMEKNPAANLPYLIDGDHFIAQTNAIMIYLVHKANRPQLLGRNCQQQVTVATVMGILQDLYHRYINLTYYGQDPFEQAKEKLLPGFDQYLKKLDKLLEEKMYFCGEQITWPDFSVSQLVQCIWLLAPNVIQSHSNLWEHQKRIWALPAIKKYHGSDRWHERPVNSPYAKWL